MAVSVFPYSNESSIIALFIASALQHPNPPCNSRRHRVSTIRVDQHKEKFGLVVVYCELAAAEEVNDAWKEFNEGEPTQEFAQECLDHDARYYRRCYRKMLKLVPHHRDVIMARPDYGWLLFDTVEELDAYLDKNAAEIKNYIDLGKWNVTTVEELRARIHKIY